MLVENRPAVKLGLCNHGILELKIISRLHLIHSVHVFDKETGHLREIDSIANFVEMYSLIEKSADYNSFSKVALKGLPLPKILRSLPYYYYTITSNKSHKIQMTI